MKPKTYVKTEGIQLLFEDYFVLFLNLQKKLLPYFHCDPGDYDHVVVFKCLVDNLDERLRNGNGLFQYFSLPQYLNQLF